MSHSSGLHQVDENTKNNIYSSFKTYIPNSPSLFSDSENLLGGGRGDWILPMHFLSDIFYCMPGGHLLYLEIIKLAFSLLLLIALWINYSLATGDDGSASHHWARGGYETVALFLNHSITVFRVFFFFSWTQLVHSHASQLREYLESS